MKITRPSVPEGLFYGVCAGIAKYFNINLTFLRIIWALSVFAWGIGLGAYILLCIILPEEE